MNYPTPLLRDRKILKNLTAITQELHGNTPDIESVIEVMVRAEIDEQTFESAGVYENETGKEATGEMYLACLRMEFLFHDINHFYFKTRELKDFLIETELKDYNSIKTFIKDNGTEGITPQGEAYTYAFHLRVPDSPCATFLITYFPYNDTIVVYIRADNHYLFLNFEHWSKKIKPEDFTEEEKMVKLAFNTLYYMLCFPESVTDGAPQGKKKNTGVKTAGQKTFSINPQIVERTELGSRGRVTHFRRGHFRVLRSDYFVNRKNDVIFVHASIVHGVNAKTISQV